MVYEDYTSTFEDLLRKNGSVTVHHRNIQLVAVEMFKVKAGLCPEIMKDLFQLRQAPDGTSKFIIPTVKKRFMGKLSLRYFGPIVWETMLPDVYKEITLLGKFKEEIKKWVPGCSCRLCKTFVRGLGFVDISS